MFKKKQLNLLLTYFFLTFLQKNTIQQIFDQVTFDCNRISSSFCCTQRVRFDCFDKCSAYSCNNIPALWSTTLYKNYEIIETYSNFNYSTSYGLSYNNRNHLETPKDLILPPIDTPLSLELSTQSNFNTTQINKKKQVLTKIRDTTTIPMFFQYTTSNSPYQKSSFSTNSFIQKFAEIKPIDMDVKYQTSYERETIKNKGVLKIPNILENKDSDILEEMNANENKNISVKNLFLTTAKYENIDKIYSQKLNHSFNVSKNFKTTYLPYKLNIKPSNINLSKSSRTTVIETITLSNINISKLTKKDILNQKNFYINITRRSNLPLSNRDFIEKKSFYQTKNEIDDVNNPIELRFFAKNISNIIDHILNKEIIPTFSAITGKKHKTRSKTKSNLKIDKTFENTTFHDFNSNKCNTKPNYKPCVPLNQANKQILNCCQQKSMPSGCLNLCRYDITQLEIKKAFEAGKCGVLNVATFLECASQKQNNLDCCKDRNIALKSGLQCEIFCNPSKGLGPLGLHHLACQNVIEDLIKCHHSGLLPE